MKQGVRKPKDSLLSQFLIAGRSLRFKALSVKIPGPLIRFSSLTLAFRTALNWPSLKLSRKGTPRFMRLVYSLVCPTKQTFLSCCLFTCHTPCLKCPLLPVWTSGPVLGFFISKYPPCFLISQRLTSWKCDDFIFKKKKWDEVFQQRNSYSVLLCSLF